MRRITRRNLLEAGVWLGAGGLLAPARLARGAAPETSRVVLIRDPAMLGPGGTPRPGKVLEALDAAVAALLDEKDARSAWRRLVAPRDVVGIKTNSWQQLPTTEAVESALRTRVIGAGVGADNVAVDDRGVRRNPVFARATALINARPMRTHAWAGLGTCLKNYIMFAETPSDYHPNACESLGALWRLPAVAGKTRLNVLVMFTPQFHGVGPHSFSPAYTWPYAGLIVSQDPVAADATGARIIAAKRREHFGEDRPISPPPHHIEIADTRYRVGNARQDRIGLVKLGENQGCLI